MTDGDDKKPREWEVSVPVPGKPFWSENVVVVEKSEYLELEKERDEYKTEIANQCEDLAEALGEVGIDVSGCYNFGDMVGRIGCLVHEVELEKIQSENAEMKRQLEEIDPLIPKALMVPGLLAERDKLEADLKAAREEIAARQRS